MPFDYAALIEKFGYVATFAGSLIEGETLLILSGLCAHRGYLSLPPPSTCSATLRGSNASCSVARRYWRSSPRLR